MTYLRAGPATADTRPLTGAPSGALANEQWWSRRGRAKAGASHITGRALNEFRLFGEVIVERDTPSKGGHRIDTIQPADQKGRRTAIAAAARRKRALYARYLSWASGSARYPNGFLGPAGEVATRSAILASAALQPAIAGAGPVASILGVRLPGAADSGGFMNPIIRGIPPAADNAAVRGEEHSRVDLPQQRRAVPARIRRPAPRRWPKPPRARSLEPTPPSGHCPVRDHMGANCARRRHCGKAQRVRAAENLGAAPVRVDQRDSGAQSATRQSWRVVTAQGQRRFDPPNSSWRMPIGSSRVDHTGVRLAEHRSADRCA